MLKSNRAAVYIEAEDRTGPGIESAKRNLKDLDESVIGLRSSIAGLASIGLRSMLAGVTGALTAGGLIAFATNAARMYDEVGKLSQAIGMSTEALSAYEYAARLNNVTNEQLASSIQRLASNASNAARGTGEARDAFRALGIEVTDSSGALRSAEELLLDIADRFEEMEDGTGKTALAMRLFGDSGAALIPLLNQGRNGLAELRAEASRFGVIMSQEAADAAARFNDELTKLGVRVQGLSIALGNKMLPAINEWLDEMERGWRRIERLRDLGLLLPMKMNPSKDWTDYARELHAEIEELEQALARLPDVGVSAVTARRNTLMQQLRDKRLQLGYVYDQLEYIDGSSVVPDVVIPGTEKRKAPVLDTEAQLRKAQLERYNLAVQLQEAEEEWAKTFAEAWQWAAHYANEELRKLQEVEKQRLQSMYDWIDWEQEQAIKEGEAILEAERMAKALRNADTAGRELGLTLSSALGDFVRQGGEARDLLNALLADIAQIFTKRLFLRPLEGAIGGWLDRYFAFEDGGIMTPNGPLPLRRYASGGIAYGPQLALFGEGRRPEAYVPLPDGRTIPVTVKGPASAAPVQVSVHNYSGERATVRESLDSRGTRRIDVVIGELVANEMRRPGSAAHNAVRTSFVTAPALASR